MNTWICKAALAGAALGLLSACGEGGPSISLLDGLSAGGSKAEEGALAQTLMANGAFTLVPPQGYCIDRASLKQRFALMARCDTLGAPSQAAGAPLGIITVSVTPAGAEESLPSAAQTADAAKLARVDDENAQNEAIVFRAEGAPPLADLAVSHWRANTRVADQLMGIALYGPEGGRAISNEGREVLRELIAKSRAAS